MTRAPAVDAATHRSTARSHVGHVRSINEDRVFDCPEQGVWAVVDGMGGHRGGDVAAQAVVDSLRQLVGATPHPTPDAALAALQGANGAIVARNAATGESAGATVVALVRSGASVHIAWAGDSRCYRLRDRRAELLTHDHSVVQQLVDAGLLTPEAATRHPQANVITRALGVAAICDIEHRTLDWAPNDRFLLCSDGLSRTLSLADLTHGDLDRLANDLLAQALLRDGQDNVSLVLVAFD